MASWLEQGIAERGSGYLVVSGGSTPKPLFSLLSRKTIDWRRVVIMLADERWVPADHDDRNEQMVRSTLLQGPAAEADFLSLIPTPDDSIANVAGLSTLLGSLPTFDVVLLGMGEDAHTASLFPCASEIKEGLSTREGALMTCPKTRHISVFRCQSTGCRIRDTAWCILWASKKNVCMRQPAVAETNGYFPSVRSAFYRLSTAGGRHSFSSTNKRHKKGG